jgi:hypothetical protein
VLPMIYSAPGAGVQHSALIQVQTANGQSVLIDASAAIQAIEANHGNPLSPNADINAQWHFSSLADFQENNQFSRDGLIYFQPNSVLPGGTSGPGYVAYSAHNWGWKDTARVVIDVGAFTAATVATLATGGVAGIVLGGVVGFATYEESSAIENAVTRSAVLALMVNSARAAPSS